MARRAWKHMRLDFDTAKCNFSVEVVGESTGVMEIVVSGVDGRPLTSDELYIGRTIDVLGKKTTLLRADAATVQWIDAETARLFRILGRDLKTLSLFCSPLDMTPMLGRIETVRRNWEATRKIEPKASVDLSRLKKAVDVVKERLNQFRPLR